MKILVLKKGNVERNVVVTDEQAETFYEGSFDEIRDITNNGYTFEDLWKGKPNTTPNWLFCNDLSDYSSMKVFANGNPVPFGKREADCDGYGIPCMYQFFTNGSYRIVGMGVE